MTAHRLRVALLAAAGLLAGCGAPTSEDRLARRASESGSAAGLAATHTVRRGESLSAIARRYGVSPTALARENSIADPDRIAAGQRLRVPRAAGGQSDGGPGLRRAGGGQLEWPVQGRVARAYGGRVKGLRLLGMVIAAPSGEPVRAAGAGHVVLSCEQMRGYGKVLVLDHGNGLITVYARADDLLVGRDERVARGQAVARAGEGGVEFRVYRDGAPQDPARYLR